MLWRNHLAPLFAPRSAPAAEPIAAPAQPLQDPTPQDVAPPGFLQIYRGYDEDDLKHLRAFARQGLQPEPGFITDFAGGRTRIADLYEGLDHLNGQVLGLPVPGCFHAEAPEWIGVMKTALTAADRYRAMEWGAGWAPWLIAGARAAAHRGIRDMKLYGVEADPHHYRSMQQHFRDNGYDPADHVLLHAAVGPAASVARWPEEPDDRNIWGARPIRDGSDVDIDYLNDRVQTFVDVQILEARQLVLHEAVWDLIHIDIQGWEGEVCQSCIDLLSDRVRWVVIGVHSRILDAELLTLFHKAGWVLEHEKPTRFSYRPAQINFDAMVTGDGVQVWRNPRHVPSSP